MKYLILLVMLSLLMGCTSLSYVSDSGKKLNYTYWWTDKAFDSVEVVLPDGNKIIILGHQTETEKLAEVIGKLTLLLTPISP